MSGRPKVGLRIEPGRVSSPEEVWARLALVPSARGWVCLPNEVRVYERGLRGPLLAAELVGDDEASLHVRQTESGWSIWRYTEEDEGELLAVDREFVAAADGRISHLAYRVYWRPLPEPAGDESIGVYRPYVARFVGWRTR